MGSRRHPREDAAGRQVPRDAGLARRDRPLADRDVVVDADLPGQRDPALEPRGTGDPRLAAEDRVLAHDDVVTDLDEVSILVPRPMTVSPSVARSIAVLAPTSTSSSIRTIPSCGIFRCRSPSQT